MDFGTQAKTFFIIAVTGVFLGVLFDLYRVLQRYFRPPWLVTSLADLVYCLLAAAIAFAALLISNWGELRFYVVIALFSGVFFYFRLASQPVLKMIVALLKAAVGVWRMIKKIFGFAIVKPVICLIKTVSWPARYMAVKSKKWYKKWRSPPLPPNETPPQK